MTYNVLQNFRPEHLIQEPYPHILIENCLPEDLYHALEEAYPSDELILELNARERGEVKQNQRNDICTRKGLEEGSGLADVWKEFLAYHSSTAFFAEVNRALGEAFRQTFPDLEEKLGCRLEECGTAVRGMKGSDDARITLDCQVGINTPVTKLSSVREVHTDAPTKLYAGLLYFRRPEDKAAGGDLEVWRWKPGVRRAFRGSDVDVRDAEFVKTVKYAPNTFVAFVNSEMSLHAVSNREPTPYSRRLVNVVGVVDSKRFPKGLSARPQKNRLKALIRRIRTWAEPG